MSFESLKMKEDENITSYLDEIVNTLRGIGEITPEESIV